MQFEAVSRIARVTLGLAAPSGPPEARYVGITRGALSAAAARGVGMLVGFVSVPLTVGYLGKERYGAWMAIGSLLAWLGTADLGLGNHLTNTLSNAFGRDERAAARRALATAFWAMTGIGASLLLVGAAVGRHVSWAEFLNVRTEAARAEVGWALFLAFLLLCLSFPLEVVDRAYTATRRGMTANAWGAAANVLTLVAILVATRTSGGLVVLVGAIAGTRFAVRCANAVWFFGWSDRDLRPDPGLVTWAGVRWSFANGGEFFVVQMAALVLLSTDNVIIARVLGAEHVTPYSVTWSLFGYSNLLVSFTFPYLWAAYAEAVARGDRTWVVRTLRRSVVASTAVAGTLLVPLVAFGQPMIAWWAGEAAVPSRAVMWWMAAWYFILAPANCVACFLNGTGQVRVQVWAGSAMAVVNVALSFLWASRWGSAGVIAATVVSYLAFAAAPTIAVAWRTARTMCTSAAARSASS